MLKWQKKHINKEQGKTKHEAPRSVNYAATQNKNNIGTTALERSVVYTTGDLKAFHFTKFTLGPDVILDTKLHKEFGSHNGFLTQSMHLSENTKSKRSLWRNKEFLLIPHCKPELKETTSGTTMGQAKDIRSSPNPLVKALCRGRHWVWGPTRRRAIKEWSIAIDRGWVNN